jgi:hypothetical protein
MDYYGTYTITIEGVELALPVRYSLTDTLTVSPVSVVSLSSEVLSQTTVVQYATLAAVVLLLSLCVGLLFLIWLRARA